MSARMQVCPERIAAMIGGGGCVMTYTERVLLRALNEAAAALAVVRNSAGVPEHVQSFAKECFDEARQAARAFESTDPT